VNDPELHAEVVRQLQIVSGRVNTLEVTLGIVLLTIREDVPSVAGRIHAKMLKLLPDLADESTAALPDAVVDAAIALPINALLKAAKP
jgi:hypothetical protein